MIEFIGFVISLLALVFIFFKNSQQQARLPQKHPREVKQEEEEDDPLNEWIRAIEQEATPKEAAQHVPPPPPKIVKQAKKTVVKRESHHKMEKRPLKTPLELPKLKSSGGQQNQALLMRVKPPLVVHPIEDHEHLPPSRVKKALQRLSQQRELVIYQEIISPPKSLRPPL